MGGLVSVGTGQVGSPANRSSRTEAHRVHTAAWIRLRLLGQDPRPGNDAPQPSGAARIPLGTHSVFGRTSTLESLQRPGQ